MKSYLGVGIALFALAACNSSVPDSGAGVGFNDYSQYELERAQREGQLTGAGPLSAGTLSAPAAVSTSQLQAVGIGAQIDAVEAAAGRTTGVEASPSNASPSVVGAGISDEQDFSAVASRETIESDAARLAEKASQYQVVGQTAVPQRDGREGPNIVEYALNAPNVKGQEWYSRFKFASQNRYQRNCASYVSADAAQRDFLARGGPERDTRGLDPDGDGFACAWDPAPFKLAAKAAASGN